MVTSVKVANDKEIANIREINRNRIKNLKEKNLKENVTLKSFTASLQKELQKIMSEKEEAINAIDLTNNKLQAEQLSNAKLVASLKTENKKRVKDLKFSTASLQKELQKIMSEKEEAINAIDLTNNKLQAEQLSNAKLVASLKTENKKRVKDLKFSTESLQKELQKIMSEKEEAINAIDLTNNKLQAEQLSNAKLVASLKTENKKRVKDLKFSTASLQKELQKIMSEKEEAINAIDLTNNKLQAEQLSNAKLVASLKTENKKRVKDLKFFYCILAKRTEANKGEKRRRDLCC